jgi:hypothetical protein
MIMRRRSWSRILVLVNTSIRRGDKADLIRFLGGIGGGDLPAAGVTMSVGSEVHRRAPEYQATGSEALPEMFTWYIKSPYAKYPRSISG